MDTFDKGTVLEFMKGALAQKTEGTYRELLIATLSLLGGAGLVDLGERRDYPHVYDHLRKDYPQLLRLLAENYHYLLTTEAIMPQLDGASYPFPRDFQLTSWGQEWVRHTEPIPEDRNGYLKLLRELIPRVDKGIVTYVCEALLTYERQALLASAVMIGAASERAVLLLGHAIRGSIQDMESKKDLTEAIERGGTARLLGLIQDALDGPTRAKVLPRCVREGTHHHLLSLCEAIRFIRNQAVHSPEGPPSRGQVRLLLGAFPHACKKVYDLIGWLNENKL